jgi:two-component system chemotaxis sensor kinase CheA
VERSFRHIAESKNLPFVLEFDPSLPPAFTSDSKRLQQIIKNLLSNAFKFTERGEVSVRVGVAQSGWNPANETLARAGSVSSFTVTDTGIGITPELQARMFEAFAQADGTTARQYGGTGLGLSISRELVRLLGGEIALTSTPDEGSSFTVYLPSTAPAAPAAPAANGHATVTAVTVQTAPAGPRPSPPPHALSGSLAGRKALVVDDDIRNVFALTSLLERCELEVVSAQSGQEAVAILEATPDIDIVLMDIMMPIMDGYATTRAMRKLSPYDDLPIIAVTAAVEAGERQRCIDAGATAYVTKPVDTVSLLLVLSECLPSDLPAGEPPAVVG